DTDYPNSILEILRVVITAADDDHRGIVGGSQQLPMRLWNRAPAHMAHWPAGTTVASLNDGETRPRVTELRRTEPGNITVTDSE
ncbi:amine oxidase, partial [Klebsiella pneumoniae]